MIQPDPAPQTPPAKVLLLGLALILLPLLCLFFLGPGPVATILVIALLLMRAAIVWQGVRNLKRGWAGPAVATDGEPSLPATDVAWAMAAAAGA